MQCSLSFVLINTLLLSLLEFFNKKIGKQFKLRIIFPQRAWKRIYMQFTKRK